MSLSGLDETILGSLRYASKPRRKLYAATNTYARPNVDAALDKLREAGLLSFKWNLYSLTKAGRNALPSVTTAISEMGHWKPEPVVRRQGTEIHRSLPSMRGGRLHYQEAAR